MFVCVCVCVYAAVAQLTGKIDPMYIIPKDRPGPHGSSSAHRQDGPHVYYTKMAGYLDIHETFF